MDTHFCTYVVVFMIEHEILSKVSKNMALSRDGLFSQIHAWFPSGYLRYVKCVLKNLSAAPKKFIFFTLFKRFCTF